MRVSHASRTIADADGTTTWLYDLREQGRVDGGPIGPWEELTVDHAFETLAGCRVDECLQDGTFEALQGELDRGGELTTASDPGLPAFAPAGAGWCPPTSTG